MALSASRPALPLPLPKTLVLPLPPHPTVLLAMHSMQAPKATARQSSSPTCSGGRQMLSWRRYVPAMAL
jgi:hypothetical protein